MSSDVTKGQIEESSQKGFKNFRSNVDVESFYRFVHENDLRREAKMLLDAIFSRTKKNSKRKKKRATRKLH